jgi:O-antigen/teichoic acid export membrane protein
VLGGRTTPRDGVVRPVSLTTGNRGTNQSTRPHGVRTILPAFVSLAGSTVLSAVASFVTMIILARTLRVETFGQLVFAQAAAGAAFAFLDPRIEDAVIRYIPILERDWGRGYPTAAFSRALLLDQGIGSLFATLVTAGLLIIPVSEPQVFNATYLVLAVLQAGAQASIGTASAGFSVTDGLSRLGVFRSVASVLSAVIGVGALFIGGAAWYLAAGALTAASTNLILSLASYRRVRHRFGRPRSLSSSMLHGSGRFTIGASLASSVAIGADQLPAVALGLVAGATPLAQFRVGLSPARLTTAAASPLASVMYPLLSRQAASGARAGIQRMVRRWSLGIGGLAVIGGLLAWVVMPFLIDTLFGSRYSHAVPVAQLLTIAALIRAVYIWIKVLPLALGRPSARLFVSGLDGTLLTIATIWLGATSGIRSVAWAHVAIATAIGAVSLLVSRRLVSAPGNVRMGSH